MNNLHLIKLDTNLLIAMESSTPNCLEQAILFRNTKLRVRIRPYVMDTDEGFVEMADLFFADDVVVSAVPFSAFHFVEE